MPLTSLSSSSSTKSSSSATSSSSTSPSFLLNDNNSQTTNIINRNNKSSSTASSSSSSSSSRSCKSNSNQSWHTNYSTPLSTTPNSANANALLFNNKHIINNMDKLQLNNHSTKFNNVFQMASSPSPSLQSLQNASLLKSMAYLNPVLMMNLLASSSSPMPTSTMYSLLSSNSRNSASSSTSSASNLDLSPSSIIPCNNKLPLNHIKSESIPTSCNEIEQEVDNDSLLSYENDFDNNNNNVIVQNNNEDLITVDNPIQSCTEKNTKNEKGFHSIASKNQHLLMMMMMLNNNRLQKNNNMFNSNNNLSSCLASSQTEINNLNKNNSEKKINFAVISTLID